MIEFGTISHWKRTTVRYCERYKETENPLYIWFAYKICRTKNIPIPEDVYEYFDLTAGKLGSLVDLNNDHIPQGNEANIAVIEAMGMKGRGPGKYLRNEYHQDVAFEVLFLHKDGMSENSAVGHVADQFSVSVSTVWRVWRALKNSLSKSE